MATETFYQNYTQVVAGVHLCLEKKLQMPALILVYTLMDTFSWVVFGGEEKSTRKRFERWTEKWILPQGSISCSATELYAARCAVLHSLTSEAALTQSGEARQVAYAWGTASAAKLQASINALRPKNLVAVHIEEIFAAVREGMAQVVEASKTDALLRHRLEEAAAKHFTSMENEKIDQFLEHVHGTSAV